MGVRSSGKLNEPERQALASLADQASVAWERVRLASQSARTAAMEETQRLRTALLASLGHDLRTPLTAIRGAAGTVRSNWAQLDESTRDDLLDSIEQDVARMARFLTNITELTRLETGQISPHLVPVNLAEAVDAASSRMANVPFIAVNMEEPEPIALADPVMLEQVLVNLLENAAKYSPSNSLIGVRGWRDKHDAVLTIADEGIGIPPDDLPHVFDSFYRATRGDRVAPGTGLGLAIARGLVEAMGGRIEATSPRPDLPRDGAPGTIVTIHLSAANSMPRPSAP
jgi:two-component system sensor histidine kinase KdpD